MQSPRLVTGNGSTVVRQVGVDGSRGRLVFFNVDGTLIDGDSNSLYLRWRLDLGRLPLRERARDFIWLTRYRLGVADINLLARRALGRLAGTPAATLAARYRECHRAVVRARIFEDARATVVAHQRAGHTVAIVTGATMYAVRPLAEDLGIKYIVATELHVVDGVLTGRVVPPLCYGDGKLKRVKALAEHLGFRIDDAIWYTNRSRDLPLLRRVLGPVTVNPDSRLRKVAAQQHWPILTWQALAADVTAEASPAGPNPV
jgi:HAD superfamily hydrolase (TIGR01490 family)